MVRIYGLEREKRERERKVKKSEEKEEKVCAKFFSDFFLTLMTSSRMLSPSQNGHPTFCFIKHSIFEIERMREGIQRKSE